MKLNKIEIQNFRAIKNIKFNAQDYTLLVGANNVGKTTIIDALRLFYEHDGYKYIEERDKPRSSNRERECWIELSFRISEKESKLLPSTYAHYKKQIKLKKWLANAPSGFNNNYIYKYNEKGELQRSNFFNMERIKNGRLGKIIYIPAISSIEQYTKLSGPSYLRDILEILLNDVISNSDVYNNLQDSFNDFSNKVIEYESSSGVTLQKFTSQISSELEPWGVKFNLEFFPPDLKFIVKNLLDWHLLDSSTNIKTHGVEMFGSGFQRHFVASLIKSIAVAIPSTKELTNDFSPKFTLFLFEEPEAYLHPPHQVKLAKNLRDLVKKRSMQVVASTHSSNFVSRNADKITNLIRVTRDCIDTHVFQINSNKKSKIFAVSKELEKILGAQNEFDEEDRLNMEVIRYFLWLDNERTTVFFAELVLLVEGLSEAALFRRLIDDGVLNLPEGSEILQTDGKYNTVRFMMLLNALGIPFITIYDDDSDKTDDKLKKLNVWINEQHKVNKFSKGLVGIPLDLEAYLGWPRLDRNKRALKPIHALFHYENKTGSFDKIKALCENIEKWV